MKQHLLNDSVARRLRAGRPVSAAWAQLGSNVSAEIFAEAGFGALIIDLEHGPWDMQNALAAMQACKGTGCAPFVRVPWNDMVWCKRALDLGACGVHVPYVSTRREAENAVRYCKYPTAGGVRGIAGSQRAVCYGLDKAGYYARADRDILVMVAIESPEGVANIDDIAAVEGVDGIFIGPSDLSTTMGHLADPSQPDVQAAIARVEAAAKARGKFLGTIAPDFEGAKKLYDRGYSLVYFLSDTTSLAALARGAVEAFQNSCQG